MRRSTAAVLATAAVVAVAGEAVSATVHSAVRAEVVVAGEGVLLDVEQIRIVDGLRPGVSYRLPTIRVRNYRGLRTTFRLFVRSGAPDNWLRIAPAEVAVDAGLSRAVGLQLNLPDDAEPGVYPLTIGVRPGGSSGMRLTFRVERTRATRRAWRTPGLALWIVAAVTGAAFVAVREGVRA